MVNTRRQLLKSALLTGIVALVPAPFRKLFATPSQEAMQVWKDLVEVARWCPSVHNLQPHRIKILSATEAELYYEPGKLLPVGDPDSRFATVAMGVFIEHLSIAAAAKGKTVEIVEIFSPITTAAKGPTRFATLRLRDSQKKEPLTPDLITKRRTSRGHYDGRPLHPQTMSRIKSEAEISGHEAFFSTDRELISEVVRMNGETLFADLQSEADRKELDALFRYTKEEAATKKDGLWAKCMGFPGKLVKSVFTHHARWEKGLRKKLLSSYYRNSFNGTATICWFGGRFENTADWLHAGRMLARNWLITTQEGAYIHPLGSLITNDAAYKQINTLFTKPSAGKKIWMILRAGYSEEPVRSYRLETKDILLS